MVERLTGYFLESWIGVSSVTASTPEFVGPVLAVPDQAAPRRTPTTHPPPVTRPAAHSSVRASISPFGPVPWTGMLRFSAQFLDRGNHRGWDVARGDARCRAPQHSRLCPVFVPACLPVA